MGINIQGLNGTANTLSEVLFFIKRNTPHCECIEGLRKQKVRTQLGKIIIVILPLF